MLSSHGRCRIKGTPLIVILNEKKRRRGNIHTFHGEMLPGTRTITLRPLSLRTTIAKAG